MDYDIICIDVFHESAFRCRYFVSAACIGASDYEDRKDLIVTILQSPQICQEHFLNCHHDSQVVLVYVTVCTSDLFLHILKEYLIKQK